MPANTRPAKGMDWRPVVVCALLATHAALAQDELPAVELPTASTNFSILGTKKKPDSPDLGLLIEGDVADEQPRSRVDNANLGLLMLGDGSKDRILYEDDHHRIIGNPSRPAIRMMYRYEADSSEWLYDGSVVRGHLPRGSHFGWSVAVAKPWMAVMDWSTAPNVAAIVIYEKTPERVRGWKKRYEVVASNAEQAKCMGGLEAGRWLEKWQQDRGEGCGVRTVDGTRATQTSVSGN